MSSYCDAYSQNCAYRCCDVYRQCPYYSYNCYKYYDNSTSYSTTVTALTGGAIAGVAIGVVVFFVGIGLLIYFCCRKRNQIPMQLAYPTDNQTTIVIPNQNQGGYGVAQPFGQPMGYGTPDPYGGGTGVYPQPYPQPYGQPVYPQQGYGGGYGGNG